MNFFRQKRHLVVGLDHSPLMLQVEAVRPILARVLMRASQPRSRPSHLHHPHSEVDASSSFNKWGDWNNSWKNWGDWNQFDNFRNWGD